RRGDGLANSWVLTGGVGSDLGPVVLASAQPRRLTVRAGHLNTVVDREHQRRRKFVLKEVWCLFLLRGRIHLRLAQERSIERTTFERLVSNRRGSERYELKRVETRRLGEVDRVSI